ncbi:MAG: MATE family efflux transporter, partial [Planctomycetota bacterium]
MAANQRDSSGDAPTDDGIPGILSLAWPLVISFALRAAFTWVDRVFAAYLPDPDTAQAAIGLAQPIEFLLIACWVGSSNGFTSRLSAAMGAHEGDRICQLIRATKQIIWGLVALFFAMGVGIWFGAEHVGLEPELAKGFKVYGTALIGGSAFTAFWAILPDSIVKAHQDTRTTMWAGIVSSVVNVALNGLFVFVFHWGLLGIGLSTSLGRLGGLAYSAWRARDHERARLAAGRDTVPGVFDRPVLAILAIAVPSGLTYILMSAESFAINGILANSHLHLGLTGEALREVQAEALAAWSIFGATASLLAMPAIATGVAVLPLAARLRGAGRLDRLQRELRTALTAWALYGSLLVVPLAYFAWPAMARALLDSERAIGFALDARLALPAVALVIGPFVVSRPL